MPINPTTLDVQGGNENNSFILSDPIEGILVVNKPLDFDNGIREFKIQIQASVSIIQLSKSNPVLLTTASSILTEKESTLGPLNQSSEMSGN